ncbi:helix-turn-helix transcriptional regulator [Reyranella sp.]|uniref:helix-turn-helix transcriptional regulator n=1 Tax=Reyranella sp. TaxID=1929291 RepID=UPI003BA8AA53
MSNPQMSRHPESAPPPAADRSYLLRLATGEEPVSVLVTGEARPPLPVGSAGSALHVRSQPLHAALAAVSERLGGGTLIGAEPALVRDPIVQALTGVLASRRDVSGEIGIVFGNAVGAALVARLVALHGAGGVTVATGGADCVLPKWRLKRVVDHVDANLSRRVRLADMADAAGLSRMYFAARFRRTTGLRPHEYLLRRRVERAQQLLRDPRRTLVEIALGVGFQTQAHFTTVFKRFSGETPRRWRQLALLRDSAPAGRDRGHPRALVR